MLPGDTLSLAKSYIQAGNKSDALPLLVSYVKENPTSEQGWLLLGYCLDDPKKKQKCFERVLSINPGNQTAQKFLGKLSTAAESSKGQGVTKEGVQAQALKPEPEPAKSSLSDTLLPILLGVLASLLLVGIPLLVLSLTQPPPALFQKLAGPPPEAAVAAVAFTPTPSPEPTPTPIPEQTATPEPSPTASLADRYAEEFFEIHDLLDEVDDLIDDENYPDAILVSDKILELNPQYAEAYYQRGFLYNKLTLNQRYLDETLFYVEQAIEDVSQAIYVGPPRADYYYRRHSFENFYGDLLTFYSEKYIYEERSLEDLVTAIQLGYRESWGNRDIGFHLVDLNRCDEALQYFKKVDEKDSEVLESAWHAGFARAYLCLGQYDKALEHIETAIELTYDDSTLPARNTERLLVWFNQGKYSEVISFLDKSIQESPAYGGWRYYLRAASYYELGDTDTALQDLAAGSGKTWGQYHLRAYVLGQIALDEGDIENATQWLLLAQASLPPNEYPIYHQKLNQQLAELDVEPLYPDPVPSRALDPIEPMTDAEYKPPEPPTSHVHETNVNYVGTGYHYMRYGTDTRFYIFKPSQPYEITQVERLVIDYTATAMSEDATPNSLQFTLYTNDAEPELVVLDMEFGTNVIEDPERFIYDGGYIYLEVMPLPPSTDILVKNIRIEVSGTTADGSLITLTE